MLPKTLIKGFDKERLKMLLALLFMALAIPTAVLIWQAYSQLKWEAFHQYRGMAEELTNRMDSSLVDRINMAEARSFADYTFLVVSGDPSASPLFCRLHVPGRQRRPQRQPGAALAIV